MTRTPPHLLRVAELCRQADTAGSIGSVVQAFSPYKPLNSAKTSCRECICPSFISNRALLTEKSSATFRYINIFINQLLSFFLRGAGNIRRTV